jgi:predicted nuclease of predicted toxin-antitoxin system
LQLIASAGFSLEAAHQNISRRLPRRLADIYPDSQHVFEVSLSEADDAAIWEFAAENGFAIVSKDTDFQQRSLLFGSPPKFIWLRVGNCSTTDIESLLRRSSPIIHTFLVDAGESHLILC